jgi:opacity protein-like surface antigen
MKRQLSVAILLLGTACAAAAQDGANPDSSAAERNVAAPFSAAASENLTLISAPENQVWPNTFGSAPAAEPSAPAEDASADPSPAPSPTPRFLYGGRDDFRWQLAIGADWYRFRSSIFNASAVGVKSGVTYFTNDWFGVEGTVTTGFAPTIFQNEHVKILTYGAGPKIAWRERRWEPWAHAILGGAHEQPQTAGHGKNAFDIELGGGADYRFNPRFSGRLEADWSRTTFFGQSQNNFILMGGVVFHF